MDHRAADIKNITVVAMFTAVLGVLSVLQFPMPSGVPLTLQTFGVALSGYVLGFKRAAAAVVIYLLIGLAGLPVFSGMRGGIGVLMGPTGGFLIGFLVLAICCGIGYRNGRMFRSVVWGSVGLLVCHLLGAMQFAFLTRQSLWQAVIIVSIPYLLKDIISVVGAYYAGKILHKSLKWEKI